MHTIASSRMLPSSSQVLWGCRAPLPGQPPFISSPFLGQHRKEKASKPNMRCRGEWGGRSDKFSIFCFADTSTLPGLFSERCPTNALKPILFDLAWSNEWSNFWKIQLQDFNWRTASCLVWKLLFLISLVGLINGDVSYQDESPYLSSLSGHSAGRADGR
jgi:hypothetical protein